MVISSCPAVLLVLFGPWPGRPAWCPWPASPGCWSWSWPGAPAFDLVLSAAGVPVFFGCWPAAARLPPLGHRRICIYCVPTWTLSWFIPNWGQLTSNIYLFFVCVVTA